MDYWEVSPSCGHGSSPSSDVTREEFEELKAVVSANTEAILNRYTKEEDDAKFDGLFSIEGTNLIINN